MTTRQQTGKLGLALAVAMASWGWAACPGQKDDDVGPDAGFDARIIDDTGPQDSMTDARNRDAGSADAEVIDPNGKFVSLQGDDGNDGSLEHPWRTVPYAVANLEPGQTLYIREGTYFLKSGEVDGSYRADRDMLTPPSGLDGKPTVITGYPGETAILDASELFVSGPLAAHSFPGKVTASKKRTWHEQTGLTA